MNNANINPSSSQKATRSVERCKRLKESIEKNLKRGNSDKAASLQVEYDRRMTELLELKSKLDSLDGD